MIDRAGRPRGAEAALRQYLLQFDWVLFMDMTPSRMNPEIKVESSSMNGTTSSFRGLERREHGRVPHAQFHLELVAP